MGRTRALIGLAVALLCPAAVSAQAPGADAREQERVGPVLNAGFVPPDSSAANLVRPQISPLSYDTLPSAYPPQPSAQGSPPDVADRVVTVWVVKYR